METGVSRGLRLDRKQQVVTLTTVSLATPTGQAVVMPTNVQVQAVQTTIPSASTSIQGQVLDTGWIVAIVSLILLAISLTFIAYQRWGGNRRASSGSRNRRSVYDRSSAYYEISRPSVTHDRSRSGRR